MAGIAAAAVVATMIVAVLVIILRRRRRTNKDYGTLDYDPKLPPNAWDAQKSREKPPTLIISSSPGDGHTGEIRRLPTDISAGDTPNYGLTASAWQLDADEIILSKDIDGNFIELGRGAFGAVYKGTIDGVTEVAVKLFFKIGEPKQQEEVLKEISILKSCRDRHVLNFLGACIVEGQIVLVTEFMESGDLWNALRKDHGLWSWYNRGKHIAIQVARGLHYLHKKRIIHFDLKSQNVLLSREGAAKISDVGLSRILSGTHTSTVRGCTFAWAAPEVLLGSHCTEKVDIYSYGIFLWEVVTGDRPQRGMLREARVPEECPREVDLLITQCLSGAPEQRPSCKEIVEVLSRLEESILL